MRFSLYIVSLVFDLVVLCVSVVDSLLHLVFFPILCSSTLSSFVSTSESKLSHTRRPCLSEERMPLSRTSYYTNPYIVQRSLQPPSLLLLIKIESLQHKINDKTPPPPSIPTNQASRHPLPHNDWQHDSPKFFTEEEQHHGINYPTTHVERMDEGGDR